MKTLARTHTRRRARASGLTALGAFFLFSMLSIGAARADSLQLILYGGAAQAEPVVVDDSALAGIRGRGTEGFDPAAPESQISIILWDEGASSRHRNQQGSSISQSTGYGHSQANSLVTRSQRY